MTVVKVDKRHIDDGIAGACRECPVALAVLDKVKEGITVGVTPRFITFNDPNSWFSYGVFKSAHALTPLDVRQFVNQFDFSNGKLGEPFEFEIDIPEWALKC